MKTMNEATGKNQPELMPKYKGNAEARACTLRLSPQGHVCAEPKQRDEVSALLADRTVDEIFFFF